MPNVIEQFRADHEAALENIERSNRALQSLKQGRPLDTIRPALEALQDFIKSLLAVHIPLEEEQLFPYLAAFPEASIAIAEIKKADESIQLNSHQLGRELQQDRPDSAIILESGTQITSALETHIRLSDLELFPLARRMLTKDQLEDLETRFRERTALPSAYPLPVIEL
ncbi:MAG: hemerythrin domain-containing protein [Bacillota bacterium]|jgi:hemerythrin-like domain-containing protein